MRHFIPWRRNRRAFSVIVLRPSKYDDDGYVIRYWRGVLPSNTVGVLTSLAETAFASDPFWADIETSVVPMDDTVDTIDVPRLARRHLGPNRRAVVALAGVQSNQFPRASDLALRFRQAGFDVMVGGFHVSGTLATFGKPTPECQVLLDAGVTLVKGEVEDCFGGMLKSAYEGCLEPLYDIQERPDISQAPIPTIAPKHHRKFVLSGMGTIDTSRGCPFGCSFCTIINVQGRQMRCRTAEAVGDQIERNYHEHRIDSYFFTDDNFSRNKHWEAILDRIIELREAQGIPLTFMMQIDTKAWKIPRFVEKSARAGCSEVFIGVESINDKNLKAVNKKQNAVDEMATMCRVWREAGVKSHAGYIIGFPDDTPESVRADVETLKRIELDKCSFFMMTPLPGSEDHARMVREGAYMHPDLNQYDSYHETLDLPGFAPGTWHKAYVDAWKSFYSFENMRAILQRASPHTYWGIFSMFMWYKASLFDEIHPMVAGLWRVKPRTDRRPGAPIEGWLRHTWHRLSDHWRTAKNWVGLFFELQELWLQTRPRPASRGYVVTLKDLFQRGASQVNATLSERAADLRDAVSSGSQTARTRLSDATADLSQRMRAGWRHIPDARSLRERFLPQQPFARLVVFWHRLSDGGMVETRAHLNTYWRRFYGWLRSGNVLRLSFEMPRFAYYLARDLRLSLTFAVYFYHMLNCD